MTALAHLTCVSSGRDRIHHELDALRQAGIENILALRGTTPRAMIRRPPGLPLCPGPGGGDSGLWWVFPSAGPAIQRGMECPSQKEDLRHLKEKGGLRGGFSGDPDVFDNSALYSFLYRAQQVASRCRCWRGSCR